MVIMELDVQLDACRLVGDAIANILSFIKYYCLPYYFLDHFK
jgi:hypothetical protein